MPTDFSAEQEAQFGEDLNRARGYKPVTPREMKQAYKQYSKVGLKFGDVKKRHTDDQLYAKAEKTVLAWWKLQQKEKIQNKKAKQARLNDPNRGMESRWTGGGGGGFGGSGGSGGMLPDTAMRREVERAGRGNDLPDIRGGLSDSAVFSALREAGVPKTWTPPLYARRNAKTLEAWVNRTAEKRDFVIATRQVQAHFDNNAVQRMGEAVNFRAFNPNAVPIKYRQNLRELRRYIVDLKKAWQRKQARIGDTPKERERSRSDAAYLVKMRNYE